MAYLFPVVGYLMGAIPMAYLVTRYVAGIDIRQEGSGNVGATNVQRTLGTKMGALVLALDVAKALLALLLASLLRLEREIILLTAVATVAGHNWPVFLGFKGGKGVAVSTGVLLYLYPLPGLMVVALFVAIVYFTRYISLGSVLGAVVTPLIIFFWGYPWRDILLTMVLALIIIYGHKGNIQRLVAGNERKISFAK
ncbi:MAG: glycerol-3-phosphate 1-O-acyltransferase PlsY [Symbiobacteriaceae bacterium]|nr:glycerol-3-phosphate 1-O-acyltransferase PlsY [Symbiobacteriaceae bacterium]